jgi:diguanylate cyclase (GGDEF)-like protein
MTIQHDILKTRLLGLLLVLTVIVLLFESFGPDKVKVISQDTTLFAEAIDDRSNGGASISSLRQDDNKFILDCEIIPSAYQWPYCEIVFRLYDTDDQGMDLRDYQKIILWAKYATPQEFGVRVQLVNFNPAYSSTNEPNSFKYNGIELFDTHTRYPQIIELNHMQVPTWWLSQGKVEPKYWGPEFNDVRGLQVSTGEAVTPGKYQLQIERIELHGKYISNHTLQILLLTLWTLLALAYFFSILAKTKRELRTNQQRQTQLELLNQLLNQEQQKLEDRLARDPLTGVLNRDGLAPLFKENRNGDETESLSLIFIDIDHFKHINDTYGHHVGDQVLLAFAQVLSQNTRTHDLIARWGGEEFVLACPDTSLENAIGLAEKLRRALETNEWPKKIKVTASFGVAQLMQNESPTDFIARADKALYVAKAQGRNCVRSSTHGPAQLSVAS